MTRLEVLAAVVLLALLAVLPAVASNLVLNFVMTALIVALAAQGWNLLGGFGGQFSFGHAAFFGTGAYADAVLQTRLGVGAWPACAVAVLAAGAFGWAMGAVVFRARLRGSYFALITLAIAEVLRICANAAPVTGGAAGLLLRLDARPANFQFASRAVFVWIALAAVAAVLALTAWLVRGRFGAYLVAVRENEDAARAAGVDTLAIKLPGDPAVGCHHRRGRRACTRNTSCISTPRSPSAPACRSRRCWPRSSAAPAPCSGRWSAPWRCTGSAS